MIHETYDDIKSALKEVTKGLKKIKNKIEINGIKFKIKWFLGGDYKFLANAMGINAANSKYPCELNVQSEANSNEKFIQRSSIHSKLYYGKTSR